MSPKRIVEKAKVKMLDMIAICDHNSAENVQATINAADSINIKILPGMEINSAEEVHMIALFDEIDNAIRLQKKIYQHLSPGENDERLFGEQIIANEFDEVEGYNKRLLITATTLTLNDIVNTIHQFNGLAIASHIDRETYSIIGQLGFIPEDLKLDALEISPNTNRDDALKRFPEVAKYSLISSSDAHFLDDIGKATTSFLLEEPTLAEIKMALNSGNGRKIIT